MKKINNDSSGMKQLKSVNTIELAKSTSIFLRKVISYYVPETNKDNNTRV